MTDKHVWALVLLILVGIPFSARAQRNPTVICVHGDKEFDCSNLPKRPRSFVQVQVVVKEHYSCTVDEHEVACIDVGRYIRSAHPSDDPTVKFCGAPELTSSEVSVVLGSISGEDLPVEFGCAHGAK
jgi:hypothetical protein